MTDLWGLLWRLSGKESTCLCRRHGFHPWVGKVPLEKERATHLSSLAWKIPQTEEPGGLQSMGLQRATKQLNTCAVFALQVTSGST